MNNHLTEEDKQDARTIRICVYMVVGFLALTGFVHIAGLVPPQVSVSEQETYTISEISEIAVPPQVDVPFANPIEVAKNMEQPTPKTEETTQPQVQSQELRQMQLDWVYQVCEQSRLVDSGTLEEACGQAQDITGTHFSCEEANQLPGTKCVVEVL